jgi:putative PIG3 family NAD(P)H quinone oxidoreductase
MRAVVITQPGDPEVLALQQVAEPEPGPGQVRVRVAAFGLNRADLLQRRGMYPAPPGWPQDIPGLEYSGEVEALGPEVTGVAVGDRVMGIVGGGSYAEYVLTPAVHAMPVPAGMTLIDAAAIPEVFVTAHDALERLTVAPDEWVLVHAVGSGVGTAAVQLIAARRAWCIGTSRTAAKLARAAELGMQVGVDITSEDLSAAVRHHTGGGAHAALDLVGGKLFSATLEALRPRGRLILVGLTAGRQVDLDLSVILRKRLRVEGTVLRARSEEEKEQLCQSFTRSIVPLFESQQLRVVIDRIFPWEQVREAHGYLESNVNFGKVVVQVA